MTKAFHIVMQRAVLCSHLINLWPYGGKQLDFEAHTHEGSVALSDKSRRNNLNNWVIGTMKYYKLRKIAHYVLTGF